MVLMPIYLVRWEGLKASLINAESEAALLDAIDEVNNPSRCTWTVYDGPIWIDFDIPIKYEIERNVSGRLRKEEVIVTDTAFPEDILVPSLQPGSDTCDYMRQTILQKAFPHLAEAFDYADHPAGGPHAPDIADSDVDWIPEPSKVRKAVVADLVGHAEALVGRGVAYDKNANLIRVRSSPFQRIKKGTFKGVSSSVLEDFCVGRAPLLPDDDGLVRIVEISFGYQDGVISSARVGDGLSLRANHDGIIAPAHLVNAFGDDMQASPSPFELRRNAAVHWQLDLADRRALARIVKKDTGVKLEFEKAP
jgi:hypothetical protein